MEEDTYIQENQDKIFQELQKYLKDLDIDNRVIQRVSALAQETVKTDNRLYEAIVDYEKGEYHRSSIPGSKYEAATAFMAEEIFQGFSKEIKKEALLEMMKKRVLLKRFQWK